MVANPYVNHMAVLTGGVGRRQLEHYYERYFIRRRSTIETNDEI
jgi:hypothetical protein